METRRRGRLPESGVDGDATDETAECHQGRSIKSKIVDRDSGFKAAIFLSLKRRGNILFNQD